MAAIAVARAVAGPPAVLDLTVADALGAPTPRPGRFQLAAHESPRARGRGDRIDLAAEWRGELLRPDVWIHPLVMPRRLPDHPSRRFGARRQGRAAPCGRGHCGVDLGERFGEVVHAVASGTIARVVWAANQSSGRYVKIEHDNGLSSYYMHLHRIRSDLKLGDRVAGGEAIGTVGRSGIKHSRPHLHLGVSARFGGREKFLDPEIMLRVATVRKAPAPMQEDLIN